jgi:hypothetical protein
VSPPSPAPRRTATSSAIVRSSSRSCEFSSIALLSSAPCTERSLAARAPAAEASAERWRSLRSREVATECSRKHGVDVGGSCGIEPSMSTTPRPPQRPCEHTTMGAVVPSAWQPRTSSDRSPTLSERRTPRSQHLARCKAGRSAPPHVCRAPVKLVRRAVEVAPHFRERRLRLVAGTRQLPRLPV